MSLLIKKLESKISAWREEVKKIIESGGDKPYLK